MRAIKEKRAKQAQGAVPLCGTKNYRMKTVLLDKRTFDQLQTLLKLSTMKLSDTAIIPKSEEELRSMADSFTDLRPDGYAINDDKRIISLMEFSRAMDTEDY